MFCFLKKYFISYWGFPITWPQKLLDEKKIKLNASSNGTNPNHVS